MRGKGSRDIIEGLAAWRLWGRIGWMDTLRRYRRTTLGPFWTSMSVAVFIATVGVVYSGVFGQDISTYLPYLCSGFVVWSPLVIFINESTSAFSGAESILKQSRLPFSIFIYSSIVRNWIVFLHHMLVYSVVMIAFKVSVTMETILIIPALFLLTINAVWVGILLGLVCTRFRDLNQVVSSLTQVAFFVTPIFWTPGQATGWRSLLVNLNPLYHLVDILRSPLLGHAPASISWIAAVGTALLGWSITLPLYNRFRGRLIYWM